MEQYAMYLRKSRADLEAEKLGEGETLKRHKEILTALAVKKELYIGGVYEEIVSGETIEARPQIQQLIKDCYSGLYKGIVVIDVDRLSRGNQANMQTIMDCLRFSNNNNGLLVITPTKTYDVAHNPDDEEYMEFVLFMSRREYKTIQKRLVRGKNQSIVEGNYMGSYRPYGYDIVKTKISRTLTPNPDEAPIVQKIFEWCVTENISTGKIAKRLNMMGVPTYYGTGEWKLATVKDILSNPIYIGKVRWNDRKCIKTLVDGTLVKSRPRNSHNDSYMEFKGKHPAIIDEETFYKAKSRFKIDKTKANVSLQNPLAGLIYCEKCGKAMRFQSYATKANVQNRLVHPTETTCQVKSAIFSDVLDAVIHGLKQSLEELQVTVDNTPAISHNDAQEQIDLLSASIKKSEKVLDKLYTAWEEGTLTDNEFVQRKQVNLEKIENMKAQLSELEKTVPCEVEYQEKILSLSTALDMLSDDCIDAKSKNAFLKAVIARISFSRESNAEFILDIDLK